MENHITPSLQSVLSSLLPDVNSCDLMWSQQLGAECGTLTLTLYSATHRRTLTYYLPELSAKAKRDFSASLACIAAGLSMISATMSLTTPLDAPASRKAKSPPEKPEKTTGKNQGPASLFTDLFGTEGGEG